MRSLIAVCHTISIAIAALTCLGMSRPSVCTICDVDFRRPDQFFVLPVGLREVSGLVDLEGGTLLTHDDERGIIYEIDLDERGAKERIQLRTTRGLLRRDFEAIASDGSRIIVITSDGLIFYIMEDESFEVIDSGLRDVCEVEGAVVDRDAGVLFLACKAIYDEDRDSGLLVFRWSLESNALTGNPLTIDKKILKKATGGKRFRASGIEIDPTNGHFILVSAQDQVILEMTRAGDIVAARSLPGDEHPQTEGVAVLADGSLVLADEGRDTGGTIAVFKTRR